MDSEISAIQERLDGRIWLVLGKLDGFSCALLLERVLLLNKAATSTSCILL